MDIKISYLSDDETIFEFHNAEVENNTIVFKQTIDGNEVINELNVYEEMIVFKRKGYIETCMEFVLDKTTICKYKVDSLSTEYEIKTNKMVVLDGIISIDYDIIIDSNVAAKAIIINY